MRLLVHNLPRIFTLIVTTMLTLTFSSCQTEETFTADAFGNKTQRQAVNFLIEESNRYTSKLNKEVKATGNAAGDNPNFGVTSAPGSAKSDLVDNLPAPRGTLKKLKETAKGWKEKTDKNDKELRLIYIRFQKVFSSYELLEKSIVDYPTFNAQLGQHRKLMRELQEAVAAVEKRPEKFKVKK
ncbi:MAG: hypothetical protein KC800_00020 [Candidatus Eremiobacteraeota bacterium]|nr:hypothetical protein [Candidatus Eremiobacteraeota bacterium]